MLAFYKSSAMADLTEQINQYKSKCLEIVQRYIDNDAKLTQQKLLQDCLFITRAHFDDIIEERACLSLCGYVLCEKVLPTSNAAFKVGQVYRIQNNKVYDISRRRNFCSDLCFKCAEFLRKQINIEPIYLRRHTPLEIHLYRDKVGLAGDEVIMDDPVLTKKLQKDEINKYYNKEEIVPKEKIKSNILRHERLIENKISAPYLKEETFKELISKFNKIVIKEKNIFDSVSDADES